MRAQLKLWARAIKRDVHALYLAGRDPRVPWYVKLLALMITAYALSPIDLIPDFIPVVGLLDDAILVPLGILLVIRMIPPDVIAEHRATAASLQQRPISRIGAAVIVSIWTMLVLATAWLGYSYFAGQPNVR